MKNKPLTVPNGAGRWEWVVTRPDDNATRHRLSRVTGGIDDAGAELGRGDDVLVHAAMIDGVAVCGVDGSWYPADDDVNDVAIEPVCERCRTTVRKAERATDRSDR